MGREEGKGRKQKGEGAERDRTGRERERKTGRERWWVKTNKKVKIMNKSQNWFLNGPTPCCK